MYRNPALAFSGGKDSLACLYLLRDQLDRLTVYWLDTGDGYPETLEVIDAVRQWVPRFEVVRSDVKAWRAEFGIPSDVVPAAGHILGVAYGLSDRRVSNRFDCCWHNLMAPMHQRMLDDGVDAVVRGTKRADTGRVPAEGKTPFYDVLLPLRDWTHDDVFAYLDKVGAPRNALYSNGLKGISAPECMGCTAWWGDWDADYMNKAHPREAAHRQMELRFLRDAAAAHLAELDAQLEG